ncbi:probable WRKY transcription factor 65 [Cynara cardunculus var. scolymus]|uniref:probable WRKY transcription factor 65 n=1 Tax=Cynara cardunculus var. scolymus TaxID=59895 RepID=UPI000D62A3B5|nr:probable WRKY transcription factor 65 [Cynara cardunculus var. scolymus]
MEVGFHPFTIHQEDNQNSPENSDDSPASALFYDTKATSTSSPKRRRGTQKRVVQVPIKDVEGSRLKGETNAPPSDSWAWRKYGQKPIKGSPYPRGYYRCSSSKGCPARKQVERSRTDPTMVMVTYSCEHNHPWPASRNNNHHHHNAPASPPSTTTTEPATSNIDDQVEVEPPTFTRQSEPELEREPEPEPDQKFTSLEVGSCGPFAATTDQYRWFSDLDSTSSTMLESPLMARDIVEDSDMAMIFSIREDEESFFADLGELPECTTVFRRKVVEEHRRNLAPWCGTTG